MALNADNLMDRQKLKSQLRKWRVLAILALVGVAVVLIERHNPHSPIDGNYIARLNIEGVITDDPERDELIEDIRDNDRVKAVIVRLDTPGGTAIGGQELYLKLKELGKVKPVVAVMRTMATSAGYMTALGADHIVAREATITGSIGVLLESVEVTELAQKLGIQPILIKSAPLKGSPGLTEKMSPDAEAALQSMIDDFYRFFVDIIVERRHLPRDQVVRLADGRAYSGTQAFKSKLIDGLGGEEEVLVWLEKNKGIAPGLKIRDVEPAKPEFDWLSQVTGSVANYLVPDIKGKLDGLVAIWHPSIK